MGHMEERGMKSTLEGCSERHRRQALTELVEELTEFSYDGLTLLREDLLSGRVIRGSWAGCVLSYKRGAAGSTRRDRLGRARNALTILWDSGWLTDEEVLAAVARERARREVPDGVDGSTPARTPVTATAPVIATATAARTS